MSCGKWEVIHHDGCLWGISEPSFRGCSYDPGDACGGCEHCAVLQGCDAVEVDSELTAHAVALVLELLWFAFGLAPVTHSETGRAWCAHCDGTGRSYERCDVTGLPVPCSCPECGGTRYADASARAPITHMEVADVECPF